MKVLQLRDVAESSAPVELHPHLTVVGDLDPARRAWLVDVLGRLGRHRPVGAEGTIEAHGIRFDLDDDAIALLGLHAPVHPVVTGADLPGYDAGSAAAAGGRSEATRVRNESVSELADHRDALTRALAERNDAVRVRDELLAGGGAAGEALTAAEADRADLERALEAARVACEHAELALVEAVTARDELTQVQSGAATRLEAARVRRREAIDAASRAAAAVEEGRIDPADADRLAGAVTDARGRAERAAEAVAGADPAEDHAPLSRRLAALERRRGELVRTGAAMGPDAGEPVAEALDAMLHASSEAAPVVAALALADTWRDLHQQISALEAGVSRAEFEAEERVAAARRAVAEAEADFNQPVLTPEQTAKVEAAHRAVLEAHDRAEGRFGGKRARRRLEELRVDERRVLERLGFSTYADYMMSASSRGVGSANRAILDAARTNLTRAEEALGELPGAADRVRRRVDLLARRDAVARRVADLLGHEPTGPEAEDELRTLREPTAPDVEALTSLAARLTDAGVDVGPEPYEPDDLVALARAYLAEERIAQHQRRDVAEAISALDRTIDELRGARDRGETEPPRLDPLPALAEPVAIDAETADEAAAAAEEAAAVSLREARWAEVEVARSAVADGEAELARHEAAAHRLMELEAVLAAATETEAAAARAVAAAEEDAGGADDLEARSAAVAAAETALAEARRGEEDAAERLTAAQATSGAEPLVAAAEERVAAAETCLSAAAATEQESAARLAKAEADVEEAVTSEAAVADAARSLDRSTLVDDVDWVLLSRLARLRAVGPGGSVPLVLDDPFAAFTDDEVTQVLDRLASMAGAVQVVVVSNRAAVVDWATRGDEPVAVHVT
jgi:hypothetical protein